MVNLESFNMVLNHKNNISQIKGDIVECGVWRGGFSIFLAKTFPKKTVWVCDSFEGFQPLEKARFEYPSERHTPGVDIAVSLEQVKENFKLYGLEESKKIVFLKGFVQDTLPNAGIKQISLLRVDVDAYSATLEVLEELYDKVQSGGYIVFDDSCLYESLGAIRTFISAKQLPEVIYDPVTDLPLSLAQSHINSDSGFPQGCYIIKN
jgi:O-methyltransferase